MTYHIKYSPLFNWKILERVPRDHLKRIRAAISQKLTTQPDFFGKPLRGSLLGMRSLRVGDYRVLFSIQKTDVSIIDIGQRATIYER